MNFGPRTPPMAWRVARITFVAIALYVVFRALPTGTNLSHMDFRVEGGNVIEMCDPASPEFLPVVNVRSPVRLELAPEGPLQAGREIMVTLDLRTHAGKPIAPEDLLTVHTALLHLLIIDPQLMDYHHVHPRPLREPGRWVFTFKPRYGGEYRIFADFTPAATGRSLYASAKLNLTGDEPPAMAVAAAHEPSWRAKIDGVEFVMQPLTGEIRAGREAELKLTLSRSDGSEVVLQPLMGAFAHIVAFDRERTGFAHLHPLETDLSVPPDRRHPVLTFRLLIPDPGRYVAWAQINAAGIEHYAPFWFEVK